VKRARSLWGGEVGKKMQDRETTSLPRKKTMTIEGKHAKKGKPYHSESLTQRKKGGRKGFSKKAVGGGKTVATRKESETKEGSSKKVVR